MYIYTMCVERLHSLISDRGVCSIGRKFVKESQNYTE